MQPEKAGNDPLEHDPWDSDPFDRVPSEHEEEPAVFVLSLAKTSYAKDCIPLENNCNVTGVTRGRPATGA
jgi:hypothetical protein